jgi:anti-sigma factor RsiW
MSNLQNRYIMRCKEINRLLLHFIDRDLKPGAMTQVEEHLATCSSCTTALEHMRRVYGVIAPDANAITTNPFAFTRIMAKIERHKNERLLPVFQLKPAMLAAAIALPLIAGVLLGYSTYNRSSSIQVKPAELIAEINNMLTTPGYASFSGYEELLFEVETLSE